jgi:hypothetical protein
MDAGDEAGTGRDVLGTRAGHGRVRCQVTRERRVRRSNVSSAWPRTRAGCGQAAIHNCPGPHGIGTGDADVR